MGHADELFVDPETVSAKLKCPICLMVCEDAVFHLPCQGGFCKGCLRQVATCPCCRKGLLGSVFKDITRREIVLELTVRCANNTAAAATDAAAVSADSLASSASAPACLWTGPLEAYAAHLSLCTADRRRVPCAHCGAPVAQAALPRHERRCARRTAACGLCGASVRLAELAAHVSGCAALLVPCPHAPACGARVPLGALGRHTEECPHAPVACAHRAYGCGARLPAAEMPGHVLRCPHAARNPLFQRCRSLESTVLDLRAQLLRTASTEISLLESSSSPLPLQPPPPPPPPHSPHSDFNGDGTLLDMTIVHPPTADGEGAGDGGRVLRGAGRLVWRVPDFEARTERFLESRSFRDSEGGVWTCRIYPSGDGNTHGFVTFGAYKTTDSLAKYSVEVVNENPALSVVRSIAPTQTRWRSAGWGWRRLMRRERVLKHGYLDTRGTLTVVVTSTVLGSGPGAGGSGSAVPAP